MIQIAVCDSSKKDAALLIDHINTYTDSININVKTEYFKSGLELVDAIENENKIYSIIFLETILEGMNGIETAKEIRRIDMEVPIIFLTVSREYAVESYEVGAASYYLKPMSKEKLRLCLDKYIDKESEKIIVVKVHGDTRFINYENIMYLESFGHYISVHLLNESFLILGKLGDMEEKLSDRRFLRCHQSYLVNMDYIKEVRNCFILTDGSEIPIRVRQKKKIADQCLSYCIDNNLKLTNLQE
jgi:DNA-binding LytR/AlgR family response regulator